MAFAILEDEMDYAQATSLQAMQKNAGYGQAQQGTAAVEAPRTIASAVSRHDQVNERLGAINAQLAALSDVIGGPRPTAGQNIARDNAPAPQSAVHRLNDSADTAHILISDIESLLNSISRALG